MNGLSLHQHSTHAYGNGKSVKQQSLIPAPSQPKLETLSEDASSNVEHSFWSTIASFQINFQVRSNHETVEKRVVIQDLNTGSIKTWSEIHDDELQQWMLEKVEKEFKPIFKSSSDLVHEQLTLTEHILNMLASPPPPPTIEISQMRISQPSLASSSLVVNSADLLLTDSLMTETPMVLELALNLINSTIVQSDLLNYHVTWQAKHLATGTWIELGAVRLSAPAPSSTPCLVRSPEVVLHQPGAYRLTAFASLDEYPTVTATFKVPALHLQKKVLPQAD